ncbi:MAG: hypothetical protein ABEI39_01935 [Halobacteriales archaeon]
MGSTGFAGNVEWWYFHAAAAVTWIALAAVVPVVLLVTDLPPGVLAVALFPFASALVLTLPAYYFDAQFLAAEGHPWAPRWRLYCLASLVLTPLVVAPVYLLQRHRHVGRP